ncbi:MAG: chorismate synthase [Bacteroidales bacterium]|jgi:chorismate synthase
MAGNTFGQIFRLTTFGESHGVAVGGVIDGCPSGLKIDYKFIAKEMSRRKPGASEFASARKEDDKVEFLSGIYKDFTTGAPIAYIIKNKDQHSSDYDELKKVFRPSHVDYTSLQKYGIRDYEGGGRSSARETAARVVAGAIAKLYLKKYKVHVKAFTSQIGDIILKKNYNDIDIPSIDADTLYCPDLMTSAKMQKLLKQLKTEGDSTGGVVTCFIQSLPAGIGEPVFDKLQADLAKAMLSIPAAKGFEYGEGFASAAMKGSEHNDTFISRKGKIAFATNHSGGIQGGISNSEDVFFKVAFKPVSSISKVQPTVDVDGNETKIQIKGRHDICVVPRAVPVVEAMAAIVIMDHLLRNKTLNH